MDVHTQNEHNRRVVARYWEEVWTKGNLSVIDELCSDNYTVFYPLHGQVTGSLPQANSGKEMRFSGTTIFTLMDGKIVEEIGEESALLALQQLGLVPTS
ncbi:hypothetical protein N7510_010475 [Penicillium lagena]|uniref:uncharacterized protein n=1 Tax=Penicillium lagena TaxID=94218 RepID=UPI00254025B9|nr:uncharacterized protein N7510_010475 [Penicillium lagena]KAJ5605321.1 hypothetical protein N7510_010475 [Penicillium lagena]